MKPNSSSKVRPLRKVTSILLLVAAALVGASVWFVVSARASDAAPDWKSSLTIRRTP